MSEKKRKRAEEPSHKKSKKVAIVAPSSKSGPDVIRVSSLVRPKLSPPVVATTPGLCLPNSLHFDSYAKVHSVGGKSRNATTVLKDLLLHSSAHRTLDYTAREEQSGNGDGLLRHYIGMFDPKTGELEVIEARKVVVRGAVRAQQASVEAMGELDKKPTNMDLRTELGETFGTKKAKKAIVDRVENAITPRNNASGPGADASEAAIMSSIQEAATNMATREQLQAAVDGAKPVPKGNYDADEIQDVYDPEQIIGSDILSSIPVRDWQEAIKKNEAINVYSQFVASRVGRVGDHSESLKRLRILRYLYFLILLFINSKPGKRGVRKISLRDKWREEMQPAPDAVLDSLRKKFTDHGEMRKAHIDLLMTTCCVLASIIDSFEVDTFELREDLRLEQKQLNQYFHEIGARTRPLKSGERRTTIAKLALPLEFPKMRMQRRR